MNSIHKMKEDKLRGAVQLYCKLHKVAPSAQLINRWKYILGIYWNVSYQ